MTESLQAWVIHKEWSGDTSARVSFFTRESGLIQCLCKGGRTPKKQSLLQSFTPLWLSVEHRYSRYYARSFESISPTLRLEGDALFSGLYINELIYLALRQDSPDEELFNAYLATLNGLASTQDRVHIQSLLRRFEWVLIHACGYSFSFTHEARSNDLISANLCYQFIAGEGFVANSKGIPGDSLLALADNNLNDPAPLKAAKIVMRQAIDHLLGGKELKTRALYKS